MPALQIFTGKILIYSAHLNKIITFCKLINITLERTSKIIKKLLINLYNKIILYTPHGYCILII